MFNNAPVHRNSTYLKGDSVVMSPSPPLTKPPLSQPPALVRDLSRIRVKSIVQIVAYNTVHEGEFKYIRNSSNYSILDSVELLGPIALPSRECLGRSIRFNLREIQSFTIIREPGKLGALADKRKKPRDQIDRNQPVELHLTTVVIQNGQQLKSLVQVMHEVDVVGISLEGENVSRFGEVSWIVMTARKTLIPLDVHALLKETPTLWDTLRRLIFSNQKLVKIFHDSRPAADYLFHRHNIELVNVFDTQIADAVIVKDSTGYHPAELRSLSEILPVYNSRIPFAEIEYLKLYEANSYKENSPWMGKPLPAPPILKYGAIKVKHLVPLRENLTKRLLEKYTKCVQVNLDIYKQDESDLMKQFQNPRALSETLEGVLMEEPLDPENERIAVPDE